MHAPCREPCATAADFVLVSYVHSPAATRLHLPRPAVGRPLDTMLHRYTAEAEPQGSHAACKVLGLYPPVADGDDGVGGGGGGGGVCASRMEGGEAPAGRCQGVQSVQQAGAGKLPMISV